MYNVSFLVDALPEHYFKAELLLFSLKKFGLISQSHILVHCTSRVDNSFLAFLDHSGYTYCQVEPFLDGTFCNKIQQLRSFRHTKAKGFFLLDIDTFILEPLLVPDENIFWAKIVDAPNPALPILKRIFDKAEISFPPIAPSDCDLKGGLTIDCNFNGGLYYIPARYLTDLDNRWRKWARWLYTSEGLFENERQRNHTDQVAMALSLTEGRISYKGLPSNYNCPIHLNGKQRTFQTDEPVRIIHYHKHITPFGMLDSGDADSPSIRSAIDSANHAIAEKGQFRFFPKFKRSSSATFRKNIAPSEFNNSLSKLTEKFGKRIRLVLHAGTPKTGSSSLQTYLYRNSESLRKRGILYPRNRHNPDLPKHQWLVSALRAVDSEKFLSGIEYTLNQFGDSTDTLILSAEGIFNHWWDFDNEAKSMLSSIASLFDTTVWIFFREPLSFSISLYQQNIQNPQNRRVDSYGRDLSFGQMLSDPWFMRHLDYFGFVCECEEIFGRENIKLLKHSENIVSVVHEFLGLEGLTEIGSRKNPSLSRPHIELLRVINRYPLRPNEKSKAIELTKPLAQLLEKFPSEPLSSEEEKRQVLTQCALGMHALKSEYGLEFQ